MHFGMIDDDFAGPGMYIRHFSYTQSVLNYEKGAFGLRFVVLYQHADKIHLMRVQ